MRVTVVRNRRNIRKYVQLGQAISFNSSISYRKWFVHMQAQLVLKAATEGPQPPAGARAVREASANSTQNRRSNTEQSQETSWLCPRKHWASFSFRGRAMQILSAKEAGFRWSGGVFAAARPCEFHTQAGQRGDHPSRGTHTKVRVPGRRACHDRAEAFTIAIGLLRSPQGFTLGHDYHTRCRAITIALELPYLRQLLTPSRIWQSGSHQNFYSEFRPPGLGRSPTNLCLERRLPRAQQ
jgi:hypothetical protein